MTGLAQALADHRAGRLDAAEPVYRAILAAEPGNAEVLHLLAVVALQRGRPADALPLAERSVTSDPAPAKPWNTLGNALAALGRPAEAADAFGKAVARDPDLSPARLNRGLILAGLGRRDEAAAVLEELVSREPSHADALNALGLLSPADRAEACFRAALAAVPGHVAAGQNLVNLLLAQKRIDDCLVVSAPLAAAHPGDLGALVAHLKAAQAAADFDAVEAMGAAIRSLGEAGIARVDNPDLLGSLLYQTLFCPQPEALVRAASARLDALLGRPASRPRHRPGKDRIRLAYLSSQFGNAPVGQVTLSLFEAHDRDRFEVVGVALDDRLGEPYHDRLRAGFDHFHDLSRLAPAEAAARLRQMELDIAVDLDGFMTMRGLRLFAQGIAPVQVFWLGHAGRLGLSAVDYLVADERVLPRAEDGWGEAVVRLPEVYHPADRHPLAEARPDRRALGLPETGIVYCAFNNPEKIDRAVFSAWMRILAAVPGAVLWLSKSSCSALTRNLRRQAERAGIAPERLVFAERVEDKRHHLARHGAADLFLDTLTLNASTTALDALWAGLPLLTVRGNRFPARIASSMLAALGLEDLACAGLDDYEARAIALASVPAELAALRGRLAGARFGKPLYDVARLTRHLEAGFSAMVERSRAGLPPMTMDVPAAPALK